MKLITALIVATTAAIASTSIVVGASSKMTVDKSADAAAAPTNDRAFNSVNGGGGKPSASQHRAQKSARMAERRARVRAAIANAPNEAASGATLRRMSPEELAEAERAADESARAKFGSGGGGGSNNPGGGFIRRARKELEESSDRKLWGNGNGNDPYEPAGGLVEETSYYGEKGAADAAACCYLSRDTTSHFLTTTCALSRCVFNRLV